MKFHSPIVRGLAGVALAAALGGCNAPAVERKAEIDRFQQTIRQRAAQLDLKPDAVLSCKACEEIALKNNLDLAVSRLALRLQDDQVRLALASAMPHANIGYNLNTRSEPASVSFGGTEVSMQERTQQDLALSTTVPVLDYGVTYYAWQTARDQRTQQRLLLERSQQELRRDVRIAYAKHAGALRQVKLAEVNVQAAGQVLRVGETMARESLATKAEVAVLRAALSQEQVDLAIAQRTVAETKLDLMRLMALPPDVTIAVDPTLPELPVAPAGDALTGLEEHALLVRPELKVQDLQRHISANSVRREFAGFFPRIDANGSFNWLSGAMLANPSYFLYGFTVADSLLDGGSQIWRYGLAKKTRTVEEERTLLLSLGVLYDVELRALQLQRQRQTIQALQDTQDARKLAFNEILSLYQEGLENEASTAKALADLNIQSLDVDKAQTDYLVTWYQFQAATLDEVPAPPGPSTAPAGAGEKASH